MNSKQAISISLAALLAAASASLAGCGKQGVLERPAPLFGAHAKAEYEAEKAQEARDEAQRAAQRRDDQAPVQDNAPRSTREVKDPNQILNPASSNPIAGAPNLAGPPISPTGR